MKYLFWTISALMLLLTSCIASTSYKEVNNFSEISTPLVQGTTTPKDMLPTATLLNQNQNECIALNTEDSTTIASGYLLLRSKNNEYSIVNLANTQEEIVLKGTASTYYPIISPDMKHFVAEVCDSECYYVLRDYKRVVNKIPIKKEWMLSYWLDNERIVILTLIKPHDVIVMNPFTGEINKLNPQVKDPFIIQRGENEELIPLSLDKSLQKALFYDQGSNGRLILWDIKKQKELLSVQYIVDRTARFDSFSWAPDGSRYVITAPDSNSIQSNALFSIEMNGTLTQLSHYDQQFKFSNVAYPVWSPDNLQIAFWIRVDDSRNPQFLATMNVNTSETKVYCQKYGDFSANRVFWNANGNQIITDTKTEQGRTEPVLIDLINLTKTNINTKDRSIAGWIFP